MPLFFKVLYFKILAMNTIAALGINETTEWWEDKKLLELVQKTDVEMEIGKDIGVLWQDAKTLLLNRH